MVRLAFANGFKLHTFYSGLIGYKGQIWNRDIDRNPADELILTLHMQTGQSIHCLRELSLNSFEGVLFEKLPLIGSARWILPLGIFHRIHRRSGMQFCPLCLKSDEIPFYRKIWRLAFYVICPNHLCLLESCCPSCLAPVAYHRSGIGLKREIHNSSIVCCYKCDFDFRKAIPQYSEFRKLNSWNNLLKIINSCESKQWTFKNISVALPIQFFNGLHILVSLLGGRNAQRLWMCLIKEADYIIKHPIVSRSEFEHKSHHDRLLILLGIAWLFEDWPNKFLRCCETGHLTRSRIQEPLNDTPFWFAFIINQYLIKKLYKPNSIEITSAIKILGENNVKVTVKSLSSILGIGHDMARSLVHGSCRSKLLIKNKLM